MAIIAPARYVVAPTVIPTRFGIFSVSTIVDVTDDHELAGIEWEPTFCGPAQITGVACPNEGVFGTPKEYTPGGQLVGATPFAVYGSWACSPIGHWDDAQNRATAALLQGEERAVERAVHRAEAGNTMSFQGATDVTPVPGTAVGITDAFAILEAYAALNFNGIGVIHANPREVTRAVNSFLLDEMPSNAAGPLTTNLGTLVASEGGMSGNIGPTGAAAGAGTHWIFMTGRPVIRRSPVILTPPNRDNGLNPGTNDLEMLAERIYVIAWDCGTVAILVNETDAAVGGLTNTQLRASPVPISGTVSITDGAGPVTVDGTVAATQGTSPWVVSGALTDTQLRATPVPISGTVSVTDGAGPLTVDGTVALDAASLAALESITVQNAAGAAAVNIQDGGNSITVDGTVAITLPSATRTQSITRVTTAVTTAIAAGSRSFTVTVVAAASAASPTLDGVALPVGYTGTIAADGNNVLAASSLITVAGDDVILLKVV